MSSYISLKIKKVSLPLCVGLLFMTPSISSYAQEGGEIIIEDMSLELDTLPPQPVQTISTDVDQEVIIEIPSEDEVVQLEGVSDPVAQPDSDLNKIVEGVSDQPVVSDDSSVADTHSGTYYDSKAVQYNAGVGTQSNVPRNVDPLYEPGSTFVVVQKSAGANSDAAKIVAAQRALRLGRNTSALDLYEQLYRKNPKNTQVLMGLAVAQQQSGFAESAIATYEELLKREPRNADARANMLGLIKTQYPEVAYRKLKEMWNNNSGSANVAAELGLISASLNNNEEAIRYLGVAASMEPNNAQHYYNMAVVYDRAGANAEALKLYEKSLEIDSAYGAGRSIKREEVYDRLAHLRRL